MNYVFVLDSNKKPCDPCHPKVARELLNQGDAAVFKRFPFTIILKYKNNSPTEELRLKIDPGSKETGLAIISDKSNKLLFGANLKHRGSWIKKRMEQRKTVRRSRRHRNCRYRKPRFLNRARFKGWLPPSLKSRVENIFTWVNRFSKASNVKNLSFEHAPFDTQKMQNPEISGIEYQQGELKGYEVKEYLLEKWNRKCSYCKKENVPFEVEHIIPKSRGGTNKVSNLCLACHQCNQKKGNKTAEEFGFPNIQLQAKKSLKDAAAVSITRWVIFNKLKEIDPNIESGFGYQTKFNRKNLDYPKDHWIDAACIGKSGKNIILDPKQKILSIESKGHGCRQMIRVDKYGFPRSSAKGPKKSFGFQTGDIVKAIISKGKYKGIHLGKIIIRKRPAFILNNFSIHPKYLTIAQRSDGYNYTYNN